MQTPVTKREKQKVMEVGIHRSTDETFLMSKKINCYYQKWMNYYKEISILIKRDQKNLKGNLRGKLQLKDKI